MVIGYTFAYLASMHALRGDSIESLGIRPNGGCNICSARQTCAWLSLFAVALVHARHGAEDRATNLIGYVDAESRRTGRVLWPFEAQIRSEILTRSRDALGSAELDRQIAAGAAMMEEQVIAIAFDAT